MSATIKAARSAYGEKQAQESRAIHEAKAKKKKDKPVSEMGHKSMSSTELDQHLATMGAAASRGLVLSVALVLVLAHAGLASHTTRVAVPLVSAVGLYLTALAFWSKRSLRQVEQFERERETWEMENFPEGEQEEMVELFEEKGYSPEQVPQLLLVPSFPLTISLSPQARQVVDILSTRKTAFVEFMMVEELGILPSPSTNSIALHSLITLVSTIAAGAIPVLLVDLVSLVPMLCFCALLLFLCGTLLSKITVDSGVMCGGINLVLGVSVLLLVNCF